MRIKTYKVDNYRECPIYYRNMEEYFEYLTIIKNEIYTTHLKITPTFFNKLFYWFGIEKMKYSQQQQTIILKQLRRMAETTIDFILNKK